MFQGSRFFYKTRLTGFPYLKSISIGIKLRSEGMILRNGMWHDLRNVIIMRNTMFADRGMT